MKVIKKAYRVWVHSHIGEYPYFKIDDIDFVYAKTISEAKYNCDLYNAKNEDGDPAKWIDIKCKRVKEYDKVEYEGYIVNRSQAIYDIEDKKKKDERNKKLESLPENEMFYVQDARNYVGNSVLWWGINDSGYVCDIRKAHKYTKEEIIKKFSHGRESDIIWNAKHVEGNISYHIDSQHLTPEYCV